MVDVTSLVVISTVVQTIVITVTLVVFILQFRGQERAIKESSYQGLMGRYNDFIGKLVDSPDLAMAMMSRIHGRTDSKVSKEDASAYANLLVAYGIIEEAFSLYSKKWIDEENWSQWAAWLKILSRHPLFPEVHRAASGTFDRDFEEFVNNNILEGNKKKEDD